jgi:uncharacterized membrane protein YeaQ/YmgE (transglycosylase-associated protein family)
MSAPRKKSGHECYFQLFVKSSEAYEYDADLRNAIRVGLGRLRLENGRQKFLKGGCARIWRRIDCTEEVSFPMQITWSIIVVWLIVGALAGSLVGAVLKRSKEGFGRVANIGIGLVGALVGGFFFKIFNINLGLRNIVVSFEDLVEAFIGSLIFLLGVWLVRKYRT